MALDSLGGGGPAWKAKYHRDRSCWGLRASKEPDSSLLRYGSPQPAPLDVPRLAGGTALLKQQREGRCLGTMTTLNTARLPVHYPGLQAAPGIQVNNRAADCTERHRPRGWRGTFTPLGAAALTTSVSHWRAASGRP